MPEYGFIAFADESFDDSFVIALGDNSNFMDAYRIRSSATSIVTVQPKSIVCDTFACKSDEGVLKLRAEPDFL